MLTFDESELEAAPDPTAVRVLGLDRTVRYKYGIAPELLQPPAIRGDIRGVVNAAFADALAHTRLCLTCLRAGQLVAIQGELCEEGEALRTTWREAQEIEAAEARYRAEVLGL